MNYRQVPMVNTLYPVDIAVPISGLLGLGATTYVIPAGGTFTGMFNVRGLQSGGAAAASAAIGVEVRSIRGVSFTNVGWGAGRDAGVVVASGIVASDTVPGVLLGKLREAATRAKARIPGSVTIDTTIRHVPTIARESTPAPSSQETLPGVPSVGEPFYTKTVFGIPIWMLGLMGVAGVAVVLITRKKKAPAPVAATPAPTLAKNRRRRRKMRRNVGPMTRAEDLLAKYDSKVGTIAHNRAFTMGDAIDYGIPESAVRRWIRAGLIKRTSRGKYSPTKRGWAIIERSFAENGMRRNYSFSSWRGSRSSALPPLRRVN